MYQARRTNQKTLVELYDEISREADEFVGVKHTTRNKNVHFFKCNIFKINQKWVQFKCVMTYEVVISTALTQ